MLRELPAIVESCGASHIGAETLEHSHNSRNGLGGCLTHEAGNKGDLGLALIQHEDGARFFTDDQAAFPMSRLRSGVCSLGTLGDVGFVAHRRFMGRRVARRRGR